MDIYTKEIKTEFDLFKLDDYIEKENFENQNENENPNKKDIQKDSDNKRELKYKNQKYKKIKTAVKGDDTLAIVYNNSIFMLNKKD